jgi:hypothetical protein
MDREDRMHLYLKYMAIITTLAIVVLISLLLFWNFWPYDPITTSPKPYPVIFPEDKVVRQGGFITYEFAYVKTSSVIPTIQRQFVDGLVFNVAAPQSPTVTAPGKGIARAQIPIPETLPPGKYYIRIIADYEMNPIRHLQYTNLTETFEVVSGSNTPAEQEARQSNIDEEQ